MLSVYFGAPVLVLLSSSKSMIKRESGYGPNVESHDSPFSRDDAFESLNETHSILSRLQLLSRLDDVQRVKQLKISPLLFTPSQAGHTSNSVHPGTISYRGINPYRRDSPAIAPDAKVYAKGSAVNQ